MIMARRMMPQMAAMTSNAISRPRQFFTSEPMKSCHTLHYITVTAWFCLGTGIQNLAICTVFQKSDDTLILKNNSVKNKPILVTFGTQNLEKTSYQMIIDVSTSPVKCSHPTL